MKIVKSRVVRCIALLVLLSMIGFNIWTRQATSQVSAPQARVIPLEGIADNDTAGKVPGNPLNAEEDFKKIYAAIQVYRSTHNGQYPAGATKILEALIGNLRSRDAKKLNQTIKEAQDMFLNPDSKYADDPTTRKYPNNSIIYSLYNKRPDGTPVGDPPSGEKDVLATTALYYHRNIRTFRGQQSSSNPVGFYMVLWHDGTIQRIAYDKILYVPKGGDGDFTHAFPNQAGVPSNALTYDEFYRLAGWKKGPRGSEGGEGQSYNDKPRR